MLSILSAVFGFVAPFLPEVVKFFQRRQDNQHELDMMELRLKAAADEHSWKMEEVNANADIAEAKEIHTPAPSFGVQMLDAAKASGFGAWATVPAFYLFVLLDFLAGLVRPTVTYAAFAGYLAYKVALFETLTGPRFEAGFSGAMTQVWVEQDWSVLMLVLAYWFGMRSYKAVFGGSASSGKPG